MVHTPIPVCVCIFSIKESFWYCAMYSFILFVKVCCCSLCSNFIVQLTVPLDNMDEWDLGYFFRGLETFCSITFCVCLIFSDGKINIFVVNIKMLLYCTLSSQIKINYGIYIIIIQPLFYFSQSHSKLCWLFCGSCEHQSQSFI